MHKSPHKADDTKPAHFQTTRKLLVNWKHAHLLSFHGLVFLISCLMVLDKAHGVCGFDVADREH